MKFIKKYYLLLLLIITLAGVSIYGTYAMFTSEIGIDAFKLEASSLPVDQEIMEYEKVVIGANDAKTIALNVSNSTSQVLHYGAWYQMISPSTINDDITIAKLTDSPDETSGTIDGNSNKNVYIYIGNNTSSEITLYVGIKYSETSSLNLPNNRKLITDTRNGKYVVGVTVTNGTVENGKTITNLITNGSFEDGSNGWSTSRTSVNNLLASTVSTDKYVTGTHSLYTIDTATNTSFWQYQSFNTTIGDRLYVNLKSNITSGNFRVAVDKDSTGSTSEFTVATIPRSDDFITFSRTYNSTATDNWLQVGSSLSATETEGYIDDVMVINLTDSYGTNYPSQEILDRSISYFDGNGHYSYRKLNKGNSTTFKVTTGSEYKIASVSCTNSNASYNESNDTLTINNITGDVQCSVKFRKLTASEKTLEKLGLSSNTGTPNFSQVATTDEGIYSAQDDYGTSYYFRGAVTNNYVKFAGYYWRIIRINGDGSIRIIYDGTSAHSNGESSTDRHIGTTVYFNSRKNDNAYVGYMYGTAGSSSYSATHTNTNNSTIKTDVDNWYKTNIENKGYSNKVADVIYCNDRSYYSGTGYGTTNTNYYAKSRVINNKKPSLTCSQQNDRFTVSDTAKGNGVLTYPVGLITSDEIAMAGGLYNTSNNNYYLYTGYHYWTMTPHDFYSGTAVVNDVRYDGSFSADGVDSTRGVRVRPVLSLKSDISVTGTGTQNDPYVVQN